MISIFKNSQNLEQPGCGFLSRGELEASIEGRLSATRREAFESHQLSGCSPCALLAADVAVFRGVETGGVLETERREFEASKAIVKAHLRQALDAQTSKKRKLAPGFRFSWNSALGLAAAAMLAVVLIVPIVMDGGAGQLGLPNGGTYTVTPMDYTAPQVRDGDSLTRQWQQAGAAYEKGAYKKAGGLFGALYAEIEQRDIENKPARLHEAALYRGIALVMTGDYEQAVTVLQGARGLAEELGFRGGIDNWYLGLAAVGQQDLTLATEALQNVETIGGAYAQDARQLLDRLETE